MHVRFYFDPLCPWCWITSHWLDEVTPHRDIEVDWRPISLHVRNEGRQLDPEYAKVLPAMQRSFGLLRIVEALRADGQADRIRDAYVAFGQRIHHTDTGLDFDIAAALEEAGIDPSFADAYDDTSFDTAVRAATAEAEEIAGDDVGTPVIAVERDGRWHGYFGPVIPQVVRGEEALDLWDGLAAMMRTGGFYELKRTRDVGPDMASVDLGRAARDGRGAPVADISTAEVA